MAEGNKIKLKLGNIVFLKYREYLVWLIAKKLGYIDLSKLIFKIAKKIDTENPGIIKGFQNSKFDGRDVIVRWKDFLWNTTIPSRFLIRQKKNRKNGIST